jgi:very-short-patch-repair endonuclease
MLHKEKVNNLIDTKCQRKSLRATATPAESILWQSLKKSQVGGLKFRRQHGVGAYILDFYCPQIKLDIELDGDVHHLGMAYEHDEIRTQYLNQQGITVLRYHNDVVFKNVQSIVDSILHFAETKQQIIGFHIDEYI